jgi:cytochrome c2
MTSALRSARGPLGVLATVMLATALAHLALSGVPAPLSAAPIAGDAARGRALVARYHCGQCHDIPGAVASRGTLGPPLQGVTRRSYIAGAVPNRPDTLQRWLIDPASLDPATPMPAVGVNERDARDIVAYLATLE